MFTDADYPAAPYPGARPPFSFAHDGGGGVEVTADPATLPGWRAGSPDLDAWLVARGGAPLAERVPVLSYGSNPCPSKLTWLRRTLGLAGPVVVLRARCEDLAAVWAAGLRVVDDQRPVVLAAVPGAVEDHAVLLLAPGQLAALDACEGRGDRHHLARVRTGRVRLLDGAGELDRVLAYVGTTAARRPLLVDGATVRCAQVPQAAARALVGVPADGDGLDVEVLRGAPDPADHPGALFTYGTLQPGASHWPLLARQARGEPRRARLPGALFDTGRGYPALRLGPGPGVSGWVVPLRGGFADLDAYEGAGYARTRVVLDDGTTAWTYVWIAGTAGLRALGEPWPTANPQVRPR